MSELWKIMFEKSEKEEAIWKQVEEEHNRFESTPEYIEHKEKIDNSVKQKNIVEIDFLRKSIKRLMKKEKQELLRIRDSMKRK